MNKMDTMEFTPELSFFQGVIISADNVHAFSRLTARGGNEDQIDYVVDNMLRFLETQQYVIQGTLNREKERIMRKYALYIILNSDLPSLEQLIENDGIDSAIWTVPTIPKCLMSEILWKLHMDKFIYEIIAFSCPELALDVASALVNHLKYSTPSESLLKLHIISSALYKQICRLDFFDYDNYALTNFLTTASTILQKCLEYFTEPPRAGMLINMKKDELYKFKGRGVETMLHVINECITEFTSVQEFSPNNFNDIYQLTYKPEVYVEDRLNFATCDTATQDILEFLNKSNELLLDVLKVLVMDVSVAIFCAWSEFEYKGRNMQDIIGELCHTVQTKLLNPNVIAEHDVVSMLEQIAKKPIDVQEIVNTSNSDVIAENIEKDNKNRSEWIKALVQKENLCQDAKLLQLLLSHLDVLKENECYQLFNFCTNYLSEADRENAKITKLLAVKCFKKCNLDAKYAILEEQFKEKCFSDSMETTDFNEMLIEIFNKVVAESNADLSDILTVFLQSPQKVYTKIFILSSENSQQMNIMLKAMVLLERFSNHYYKEDIEASIIRIAQSVLDTHLQQESSQQNFINFFTALKTAEIIPSTKLLMQIIMPKVHKALLEINIRQTYFQCKLLSKAFTKEELLVYRAPMLAMIAQIMLVVRWKINNFEAERPHALALAIDMLKELFSTYGDNIPEKEKKWLISKVYKLNGLNSFYFKVLWIKDNYNFVESITGYSVEDIDNEMWVSLMAQMLPFAIQSEWLAIWNSFPPLPPYFPTLKLILMHKALTSLTNAEAMYRENSRSFECVMYCYRNFVNMIQCHYFTDPLTNEQVMSVVRIIANTANIIGEPGAPQLSTIFIPVLVHMVTKKTEYVVNIREMFNQYLKNNVFKERIENVIA